MAKVLENVVLGAATIFFISSLGKGKMRKKKKRNGFVVHLTTQGQISSVLKTVKPGNGIIVMVLDVEHDSHTAIMAEIRRFAKANPDIKFAYGDHSTSSEKPAGHLMALRKGSTSAAGTVGGFTVVGDTLFDGTVPSLTQKLSILIAAIKAVGGDAGTDKKVPDEVPGTNGTPSDECDILDPSTWGGGNICVDENGRWVKKPAASGTPDTVMVLPNLMKITSFVEEPDDLFKLLGTTRPLMIIEVHNTYSSLDDKVAKVIPYAEANQDIQFFVFQSEVPGNMGGVDSRDIYISGMRKFIAGVSDSKWSWGTPFFNNSEQFNEVMSKVISEISVVTSF